jgi:regulator of sigma E protease
MTIIATIVLLGVLIFVHELGHFLAARSVGIRVERFSIGFGPRIWGFERGDTEYILAAIPLGGT